MINYQEDKQISFATDRKCLRLETETSQDDFYFNLDPLDPLDPSQINLNE